MYKRQALTLCACDKIEDDTTSNDEIYSTDNNNIGRFIFISNITPANADDISNIADNLIVKHRIITNVPSDKCDKNIANGSCFEVELALTAKKAIRANQWQIHFSQTAPIQSFESKEFSVKHINGDLHQISLTDKFLGFEADETKRIIYRSMFWSLSETDAIPNYIVSAVKTKNSEAVVEPQLIKSTLTTIDPETQLEVLPFVVPFNDAEKQFKRSANDQTKWLTSSDLYQRNAKLDEQQLDVSTNIIPTPKKLVINSQGQTLDLKKGINVSYNNVEPATVNAAMERLTRLGVKQTSDGVTTTLSIESDIASPKHYLKPEGSYRLNILSLIHI